MVPRGVLQHTLIWWVLMVLSHHSCWCPENDDVPLTHLCSPHWLLNGKSMYFTTCVRRTLHEQGREKVHFFGEKVSQGKSLFLEFSRSFRHEPVSTEGGQCARLWVKEIKPHTTPQVYLPMRTHKQLASGTTHSFKLNRLPSLCLQDLIFK